MRTFKASSRARNVDMRQVCPGASRRISAANTSRVARRLDPAHGPGLTVTLDDAQRDANGRFPRDASPDDLVVHQQDIQAVLRSVTVTTAATGEGGGGALACAR